MKKIPFGAIFFVILVCLTLLIDLPTNQRVNFAVGPLKVDRVISPPKIDFTLFGKRFERTFETKLGLDLRGGSHLLFEADIKNVPAADVVGALESARNVIAVSYTHLKLIVENY